LGWQKISTPHSCAESCQNASSADLKRAFENAGFSAVKTVLASGNVVFNARAKSVPAIERQAEKAIKEQLGRTFFTIVRPMSELLALLEADPFSRFELAPGSKKVVSFLRSAPKTAPKLPISQDGAHVLLLAGHEVFSGYVPSPRGPVFMTLIQKTFGDEVTTRTWDTVRKVAAQASGK